MNEILIKEEIENMIHEIRGKQVIFDRDVAKLYSTKTSRINEVVKRNINRFSDDFCFQLSSREWLNLKSQFAT